MEKKFFITRATGMVGSAIYRKLKEYEINNKINNLNYLVPSEKN